MKKRLKIGLPLSFVAGAAAVWLSLEQDSSRPDTRSIGQTAAVSEARLVRAAPREDNVSNAGPSRADGTAADALARAILGEAGAGLSPPALSLLLRRWASTDPAAFLEALPALVSIDSALLQWSRPSPLVDALHMAAEVDPHGVLEFGSLTGGTLGRRIQAVALEALAEQDSAAAIAHLADVEPGEVRDRWLAAVATGFARGDLNRAVGWLSTLTETDGAAFYPVIDAVALVDLSRAIELDIQAIELDYGGLDFGSMDWLMNGLLTNRHVPSRIADQLAAMRSQGLLADTLSWWATSDPYGAIAWIQSQPTISSMVVERLASELARQDYTLAMSLAEQFPPAVRAPWLGAVIGRAAEYDITAAREALELLRAESVPEQARDEVLRAANRSLGAPEAARMAGDSPTYRVVNEIATDWARFDPAAAAAWVQSIRDPIIRARAAYPLLNAWVDTDPDAAESWVASLADPEFRASSLRTLTSLCYVNSRCAKAF